MTLDRILPWALYVRSGSLVRNHDADAAPRRSVHSPGRRLVRLVSRGAIATAAATPPARAAVAWREATMSSRTPHPSFGRRSRPPRLALRARDRQHHVSHTAGDRLRRSWLVCGGVPCNRTTLQGQRLRFSHTRLG